MTDGANVYCAVPTIGVWRFEVGGGTKAFLGGLDAVAVAVDATFVYWADNATGGGSILKAPK